MGKSERLNALRELMARDRVDTVIFTVSDPHIGEYITDHWKIVEWLTGFTGSAGIVVVTATFAGLWTDSRYTLQAEDQLHDSEYTLMPASGIDYLSWINIYADDKSRLAFDGRLFSIEQIRRFEKILAGKHFTFKADFDPVSEIWNDRPDNPHSLAFDHLTQYCGKSSSQKIAEVRTSMEKRNITYQLLTYPDDIMWLLNIRGADLRHSPLIISFALVGAEQILLFADESKFSLKIAHEFDKLGIVLLPYEETAAIIASLSSDDSILYNPSATNYELYRSIPDGLTRIEEICTPTKLKAVKNETEQENILKAMIKDGVALTKFFYWFENTVNKEDVTELKIVEKIDSLRAQQENYLSPSFTTIVAFNEHGALPHYSVSSSSDCRVRKKGILLIDSGGQYMEGTTDITRTIAVGAPSSGQIKDFSLVLKGMIDLAMAEFPRGTKGYQLDILARRSLWENGLNYGHGTGHGVGFCLNVHEGPQSISPGNGSGPRTEIEPGMLISNEPAVYRDGEYGIRTENLILCKEASDTGFGRFLKFETVSYCFIDRSLIDISLLDNKEISWLNVYHEEVYEKISPHLTPEEQKWLKEKTLPLD
jgi:Xaa-Pro aminopeptidase